MRRFLFFILTFSFAIPLSIKGSTLPESEPNFRFAIDQVQSTLGAEVELSIRNVSDPSKPGVGKGTAISSFSFFIEFDTTQLVPLRAERGQVLAEQGWEALIVSRQIECSSSVCRPSGKVSIKATAESQYKKGHPSLTRQNTGEWLVLKFKVKNDCILSGQFLPVSWYWQGCTDNTLANHSGTKFWIVDSLINSNGQPVDFGKAFPQYFIKCDTVPFTSGKVHAEQGITFVNGGIRVAPDDCITNRGDLNLNGIAYEIADYLLYQNYFLYGDSVFYQDIARLTAQIKASDVNADGIRLRVSDLVMMARVIRGEANPLPKADGNQLVDTAQFYLSRSADSLFVSCRNSNDIGGIFLFIPFSDSLGPPILMDSSVSLQVDYNVSRGRLRVLLSPDLSTDSSKIPNGERLLLSFPLKGYVPTPLIQASNYEGQEMPVAISLSTDLTPPRFSSCPPHWDTLLYGRTFSFDFESDREGETGVIYSISYGPGQIDSLSGVFSYVAICQLQPQVIVIQLRDKWGNSSICKFAIVSADSPPSTFPAQQTVTVSHGQMATNQIQVSDPDSGDSFTFTQTYELGTTDSNGNWTYQTSCRDVGASPQTVYVRVADGYGNCRPGPLSLVTSFQLVVTNAAPSILCPPNTQIVMGRPYQVQVTGQDPDPADSGNLTFSLVSGPAGLTVFPSGLVQWTPTPADLGTHQVHLYVTDICGATAFCSYSITVMEGVKFRIAIDTVSAEQNADVEVSIHNLNDAGDPGLVNGKSIGGFSFLMSYDCACLQFLAARKGALLVQQDWEFFTYRYGAIGSGNCGSGCPSCLIRIVAIADVNDGNQPNWTRENQGELAVLKFRTTADRTLAGQLCPISWFWFDCNDNTISDSTGQRLWTVNALYDVTGAPINLATSFPTNVSACTTSTSNGPQAKKFIDFVNGGIRLPQPPYDEFRGDLNLNGISFEVADFELFKNYFTYGDLVFYADSVLKRLQILNSDVNGDGLVLDISDLVTMARILTGDANPLPRGEPKPVNVSFAKEGPNLVVTTNSFYDLGGLFLRLHLPGTAGTPVKLDSATGLEIKENAVGGEIRILLVASQKDARIPPGTQRVLSIPCDSFPTPVEVSACDYYGIALPTYTTLPVNVELSQQPAPTSFGLSQNFPNPFNPSTSFTLSLPKSGRYSVRIYNLAGQVVRTFEGEAPAGRRTLTWDGTDQNGKPVSSGIYFYKANAAGYSETKKMILIR